MAALCSILAATKDTSLPSIKIIVQNAEVKEGVPLSLNIDTDSSSIKEAAARHTRLPLPLPLCSVSSRSECTGALVDCRFASTCMSASSTSKPKLYSPDFSWPAYMRGRTAMCPTRGFRCLAGSVGIYLFRVRAPCPGNLMELSASSACIQVMGRLTSNPEVSRDCSSFALDRRLQSMCAARTSEPCQRNSPGAVLQLLRL